MNNFSIREIPKLIISILREFLFTWFFLVWIFINFFSSEFNGEFCHNHNIIRV
jgi:hypothetical protein